MGGGNSPPDERGCGPWVKRKGRGKESSTRWVDGVGGGERRRGGCLRLGLLVVTSVAPSVWRCEGVWGRRAELRAPIGSQAVGRVSPRRQTEVGVGEEP